MIKDLVIHIGNHKTASTSIQKFLYNFKGDFYYPPSGAADTYYNHNWYVRSLGKPGSTEKWDKLRDLIKNHEQVVISSAAYSYMDPVSLKDHFQKVYGDIAENVRLIWYIRPHLDFLVSMYLEQLRIGIFAGTIGEFIELCLRKNRVYYYQKAMGYKRHFRDSITIRPLVKEALVNGDPNEDILSFIYNGNNYNMTEPLWDNTMIPVQHLAIIKHLQDHSVRGEEDKKDDGWLWSDFLKENFPLDNPVKYNISKRRAEKLIREGMMDDCKKCDAMFGAPYLEKALLLSLEKALPEEPSLDIFDWKISQDFLKKNEMGGLHFKPKGLYYSYNQ